MPVGRCRVIRLRTHVDWIFQFPCGLSAVARCCTEAVRTQSREFVLGVSVPVPARLLSETGHPTRAGADVLWIGEPTELPAFHGYLHPALARRQRVVCASVPGLPRCWTIRATDLNTL